MLWEHSAYNNTRTSLMKKYNELLKGDYEEFDSLENVDKSSYICTRE